MRRPNRQLFLPSAVDSGFRAVCVQPGHYPADLARRFGPFVDLLLTRSLERKKPPGGAARNVLM
jgi:hypothetical protein